MQERNSEARFGDRCRKRPHCCRELRLVSICCGHAALPGIPTSLLSKKKSFLFEGLTAHSRPAKSSNSRLETRNSKLETRNSKLETSLPLMAALFANFSKICGRRSFYFVSSRYPRYFFTSFRLPTGLPIPKVALSNPGAAEDAVVVVENGALAWCDGALRSVEGDAGARTGESFNQRGRGFVLVADFYLCTD